MSSFPFVFALLISLWVHFIIVTLFAIKPLSRNFMTHFSPRVTFLGSVGSQSSQKSETERGPAIKLPNRTGALETVQDLARESVEMFGDIRKGINPFSGLEGKPDSNIALFPSAAVSRKYLTGSRESLERAGLNSPKIEIAHRISYPDWARKRGVESELKLLFRVTPDGFVDQVEIDRLSGYPELDMLGVEEVYRWRFNPLKNKDAATEWGAVIIKFILE